MKDILYKTKARIYTLLTEKHFDLIHDKSFFY